MRRSSGLYVTRYVYIWVYFFRRSSQFLEDVIEVNGKMVLQNIEIAEWFTETYYKEVIDFFMQPMNIYGNDMLAKTLKLALHKKVIHADDFLLEDDELISKLQQCSDPEVHALVSKVHPNVKVKKIKTIMICIRKIKYVLLIHRYFVRGSRSVVCCVRKHKTDE